MFFVMKTWLQTILLSFCILFACACGQSEAYFAVQPEDSEPVGPGGGKADDPFRTFEMSDTSLTFEGEGYESTIILDTTNQIDDSFGKGATSCRHNTKLGGLTIDWDGEASVVWARERSGELKGTWRKAQLEVDDNGSYKVRVDSNLEATAFDVYFENPEALDFVLIQPVEP